VGGSVIDGSGGTTVYISQVEGINYFSYDQINLNSFNTPTIFANTDILAGVFTVIFDSDFIFDSLGRMIKTVNSPEQAELLLIVKNSVFFIKFSFTYFFSLVILK
jgi:hypothetical protein